MLRSDDPLPQNVIRFSDAFEQFFHTVEPRSLELEEAVNVKFNALIACKEDDLAEELQGTWHAALVELESGRAAAWTRWRSALESGLFVACIRDPAHNEILELDKKGWGGSQGLGPRCSIDDYVCPDDLIQPGPMAAIGGKLRPVFFIREAFQAVLSTMSGSVEGRQRKGIGRRVVYDREFVRKSVHELMDHHGEFLRGDLKWRSSADLERAVQAALEKKIGTEPATSTVRELIAEPLEDWRRRKAADN